MKKCSSVFSLFVLVLLALSGACNVQNEDETDAAVETSTENEIQQLFDTIQAAGEANDAIVMFECLARESQLTVIIFSVDIISSAEQKTDEEIEAQWGSKEKLLALVKDIKSLSQKHRLSQDALRGQELPEEVTDADGEVVDSAVSPLQHMLMLQISQIEDKEAAVRDYLEVMKKHEDFIRGVMPRRRYEKLEIIQVEGDKVLISMSGREEANAGDTKWEPFTRRAYCVKTESGWRFRL